MGAASAWSLVRRGWSVVMLEQFEPAHTRGSSHGGSRIFRLAYPDPFWIELARAARDGWRELEADCGAELLVTTGSVDHGAPAGVQAIESALVAAGVPFDVLDPEEAQRRWPGMRFDGPVCHQPDGGRVASRARAASHDRRVRTARWCGALERAGPGASRTRASASVSSPTTRPTTRRSRSSPPARGSEPLLAPRVSLPPLVVTQESAFHFAPREPLPWPSFIHHGAAARYGLETPGEGVKVAEHHTGPVVTRFDARLRRRPGCARARRRASSQRWFPGLGPEPVSEVTCLYTNTATEDFVLDRVGPIVVVSACSGHGFKFAPLIGRMAADLADGAAPVTRFALPR